MLGVGRRFVLKSIAYDSVHRTDLMRLPCPHQQLAAYLARPDVMIMQQQPWILQEFIQVMSTIIPSFQTFTCHLDEECNAIQSQGLEPASGSCPARRHPANDHDRNHARFYTGVKLLSGKRSSSYLCVCSH